MKWHHDTIFTTVAAIAWPQTYRLSVSEVDEYAPRTRRQMARTKMSQRYLGWKALDEADSQITRFVGRGERMLEKLKALRLLHKAGHKMGEPSDE